MYPKPRIIFIITAILHLLSARAGNVDAPNGSCQLGGKAICVPSEHVEGEDGGGGGGGDGDGGCDFSQKGTRLDISPRIGDPDGVYDLALTILKGGCLYDMYTVAVHLMDGDDEQLMHTYHIPSTIQKCSQVNICSLFIFTINKMTIQFVQFYKSMYFKIASFISTICHIHMFTYSFHNSKFSSIECIWTYECCIFE